jgi:phage terminase small subunit
MKGRKKKPLAIVRLEGNPGKRKLSTVEEEVTAVPGAPACPSWLNAIARAEWARIIPLLNAQGTLAQIDMAVIAGYCQCYAIAAKYGKSSDKGDLSIAKNYFRQYQSFGSQLGISPSDRAKLSIPGRKSEDEMEKLLDRIDV